jgi:hypothetical protein
MCEAVHQQNGLDQQAGNQKAVPARDDCPHDYDAGEDCANNERDTKVGHAVLQGWGGKPCRQLAPE